MREQLDRIALRVGAVPSALVVGTGYATVALIALLAPGSVAPVAGLTVLPLVAVYCWMRPARRLDVFLNWLAPGCAAGLAHDLVGIPGWTVGVPLVVLVLLSLADDDRAERRGAAATAA